MIDGVHIWRAALDGPSWPILRHVLANYLGSPPESGDLQLGERGKPRLRQTGGGAPGVEFNLSHSQGLVLVAVAGRPVGVDLEALRPRRDLARLAERFLGAEEAAAVRETVSPERERVFYRAWTRHEARLKCLGLGLGTGASAESTPSEKTEQRLAVESFEVAPAYAAAVAVLGEAVGPIECRSL